MNPEQPTPQQPVASAPQPQENQPHPVPPAANNDAIAKKVKNAGRSLLAVGVFYIALSVFGVLATDKVSSSERDGYILGLALGAVMGVAWSILGLLLLRSKSNAKGAAKLILISLAFGILLLVVSALKGSVSIGTVVVLVVIGYLIASYLGIKKLIAE